MIEFIERTKEIMDYAKKNLEIEVRCTVYTRNVFLKIFRTIQPSPVFPGMKGLVRESNFTYRNPANPRKTLRLRRREFSDGSRVYIYTEKGKSQSKHFRKKEESEEIISNRIFQRKKRQFKKFEKFIYERRFFAEEYCMYHGVCIELFRFPMGRFVEFELKKGTLQDLQKVMRIFGFTLKDSITKSTQKMWHEFLRKKGLPISNKMRFSE